jgi:hypothetical protein
MTGGGSSWESAPRPPGLPPGYQPDGGGGGGSGSGPLPPWEDPAEGWLGRRYLRTVLEASFHPVAFFDRVANGEDLGKPLLFGFLTALIAQIASVGHELLFGPLMTETIAKAYTAITGTPFPSSAATPPEDSWMRSLLSVLLLPVVYPVGVFIGAAIVHGGLALFGGANRSFAVTVRALAYTASPQLLGIFPVVGPLIAGVWVLALEIVGIARVHNTSYGKSAAAVLAPTLCLCVCVLGLIAIAGAVLAKVLMGP